MAILKEDIQMKINFKNILQLFVIIVVVASGSVQAERIKDLASIAGVRSNHLIGYGLVVGLNGTGDQTTQTPFTTQSIKNMLEQLGVTVPTNVNPQLKNVAAVMVTSELPPFAKPGQKIDVTVSSLGTAKSLRGGTLLLTPLKGGDGQTYAIAQGNLVVGGLDASGRDGSSITVNIPSAGRIPGGGTVEVGVSNPFAKGDSVYINLHRSDFTTATRLSEAVNRTLGQGTAEPMDAATVRVRAPVDPGQRVSFVSLLEKLDVQPGEAAAKVIVNSRTGTVVISNEVRVRPAAVSHGGLVVTITEDFDVSQPAPFSGGETVVTPDSQVTVEELDSRMFLFNPGVGLDEIVRAVNDVGAAPGDLVAILEALKQAGALQAELIVI
jgi:flagellar P-ring protein precursor FlgI